MNSVRSRIRVIGVRRSWLIAASILVRSSTSVMMRPRMALSARATERISSGPRSGSGAVALSRLKVSAALASADNGADSARAAHRPSNDRLTSTNSSIIAPGPRQNGGGPRKSGPRTATIISPSGSTTARRPPGGPSGISTR